MEVFILKNELLNGRENELTRVRQLRKDAMEVLQSLPTVKERVKTIQVPDLPSSLSWTWESDFSVFPDDDNVPFDDGTDGFMKESSQILPQTGNTE
jgi:hypothetical protein